MRDDPAQTWFAFYSAQAAEAVGGVIEWLRADGSPVTCTAVWRSEAGDGYEWPDKELRGPVVEFSRVIVPLKSHDETTWGIC